MIDLDRFLISQGVLPWQPILWQNFGIYDYSAQRRSKKDSSITILIKNV